MATDELHESDPELRTQTPPSPARKRGHVRSGAYSPVALERAARAARERLLRGAGLRIADLDGPTRELLRAWAWNTARRELMDKAGTPDTEHYWAAANASSRLLVKLTERIDKVTEAPETRLRAALADLADEDEADEADEEPRPAEATDEEGADEGDEGDEEPRLVAEVEAEAEPPPRPKNARLDRSGLPGAPLSESGFRDKLRAVTETTYRALKVAQGTPRGVAAMLALVARRSGDVDADGGEDDGRAALGVPERWHGPEVEAAPPGEPLRRGQPMPMPGEYRGAGRTAVPWAIW
jgi:hypothetical protein